MRKEYNTLSRPEAEQVNKSNVKNTLEETDTGSYKFKRIITPKWKCEAPTRLLLVVTSTAGAALRRESLRRTWCSDPKTSRGDV